MFKRINSDWVCLVIQGSLYQENRVSTPKSGIQGTPRVGSHLPFQTYPIQLLFISLPQHKVNWLFIICWTESIFPFVVSLFTLLWLPFPHCYKIKVIKAHVKCHSFLEAFSDFFIECNLFYSMYKILLYILFMQMSLTS